MKQTKGKTLEQIDLLFTGPKVLLDMSEDELLALQESHMEMAIHKGGKQVDALDHVEVV